MSNKKKLQRYADLGNFKNVFEPDFASASNPSSLKGCWAALYFKNNNSITLELACGKGEYTVNLARQFPDQNFIGIDIKGDRLWHGASMSEELKLANTAFLRIDIRNLNNFFAEREVDAIWITFPDPHPKDKRLKKRLTNPGFLKIYQEILKSTGKIHLKTDNEELFEFTLEVIHKSKCKLVQEIRNIYAKNKLKEELKIRTYYEKKYLAEGRPIHYLSFQFPS